MAVCMTVLVVLVASATYAYVVPVVLSPETHQMIQDRMNDALGSEAGTKDVIANVMKQTKETQDVINNINNNNINNSEPVDESAHSEHADETQDVAGSDMPDRPMKAERIPYKNVLGGKITKVVDGDTLDIDGTRIRLALVDTPEAGESGHAEAAAFTRMHCPVSSTAIYDVDDSQTGGSYGRTVAKVWCYGHPAQTPDRSINSMLVDAGHAEILARFCNSEYAQEQWAGPSC